MPASYGRTSSKITHDGSSATTQIVIAEAVQQQVDDFLRAHNIASDTFDAYVALQLLAQQLINSYQYIFQAQTQTYNFLMELAKALNDNQYVIDGVRTKGILSRIEERLDGFVFA